MSVRIVAMLGVLSLIGSGARADEVDKDCGDTGNRCTCYAGQQKRYQDWVAANTSAAGGNKVGSPQNENRSGQAVEVHALASSGPRTLSDPPDPDGGGTHTQGPYLEGTGL